MWRGSFNLKKVMFFFVCAFWTLFRKWTETSLWICFLIRGTLCFFCEFAAWSVTWVRLLFLWMKMPHAAERATVPLNATRFDNNNNNREAAGLKRKQKRRALFFPTGVICQSETWQLRRRNGTNTVCVSHSLLQTLPPPWPWERHASASLKGSSNVCVCVCECTYQHVFMYILAVLLLFCSFNFICAQLELIFGGTNCQAARSPESDSPLASRSASAATWNKSWQQQQQGSSRRHADWHFRYADEGVKIAIRTTVVCFQISPFCSVFGFKFFICFSLS